MPGSLRTQVRQRGLHDPQRSEQIRLELRAGLSLGGLLDGGEQPEAGVVDDDVEPAEVFVACTHGVDHGTPVQLILELESECTVQVERRGEVGDRVHRSGGRDDGVTARERRARPHPAEAS